MILKEKLIVRISGFGKNSVSKFWKNKKLNVLDMGYTLIEVSKNGAEDHAFRSKRYPDLRA